MKLRDRKRISRAILSTVSGLHEQIEGRLLVQAPTGRVLRGFCIETSSQADGVYLWTFVQPLYVPATTIVLNLGERLGASRLWRADDVQTVAETAVSASSFYALAHTPEALTNWNGLVQRQDEYAAQAMAYSLLIAGRTAQAIARLRNLTQRLVRGTDWMKKLATRDEQLALLAETSPPAALKQLEQWERETRQALKLDTAD